MMRKSLAAAVAAAPLLAVMAGQARAETQITTATTAPVATATAKSGAPDDLHITNAGSVSPTSAAAPAVTLNSNNTVTNEGSISFKDVDNAIGIEIVGPVTGQVTNSGGVTISESYTPTDSNSDGVVDGPWSKQTGGVGIEVTGGVFTGGISSQGAINVSGNGAEGVSIRSEMTGSLLERVVNGNAVTPGAVTVTGSNAIGVHVTSTGKVDGDMKLTAVTAHGDGATAVKLDGAVGGMLNIAGPVSATGYRSPARITDTTTMAKYTADELQQGGAAVNVGANVGGGIIISAPPVGTTTTTDPATDADHDGVPDLVQGTGSIVSQGGAPALQIGAVGSDVTVGALTSIDAGYGLVNQGTITADGVFDKNATPNLPANVAATAIQVGVTGGGAATVTGGMHNIGTIQSNAYEADSTAIHVLSGGSVAKVVNDGTISATATTDLTSQASAIKIDAGATVTSLTNTKTITSNLRGSVGSSTAILDNSGTLSSISNTGAISALITQTDTKVPVTGAALAIDARANTTGVTVTQTQSTVTDAAAPSITGAIALGNGDDLIDVKAGVIAGDIGFNGGVNTISVEGDVNTKVTGGLFLSNGGSVNVNVTGGQLSVTNTQQLATGNVNVGASGVLLVAADPQSASAVKNTEFLATGTSTFANGAQIGLTLNSLQVTDQVYTILTQTSGTLTTGTFGTGVLNGAPYLYNATASADASHVYLTVQRKTAAQLGFSRSEAAAYDAVFGALLKDTDIQKAFLAQTTRAGLESLYDQMLPDQGVGVFEAFDQAALSVANMTGTTPDVGTHVAGTSLWLQEVNDRVQHHSGDTLGSRAQLFGLVGGYEHMGAGGGAVGLTLAYYNVQDRDSAAAVGEHTVASMIEGGAYYRRAIGGLRFSMRGSGGYAFFDGDRQFVTSGVKREAKSSWGAFFATAHAGAAWEQRFGRFYVRPELSADYTYLREGSHTETGGGDGFDLAVASRSSYRFSGAALMTFGAQFGRDMWLRPEIRGGYRKVFASQLGQTTAEFTGSGTPFFLDDGQDAGGWATVGFSLKGGTSLSYMALEGDMDFRDGEQRYDLRIAGRSMF
ncbi:MAG TPA: autotransporter outer membrane beta-barrel domain-containing protein [Caulobacteraceae bacterium]|nr:autotransporter outer membrane beta-barrel domain-containing protein [Caulobacteraceae bacterium]